MELLVNLNIKDAHAATGTYKQGLHCASFIEPQARDPNKMMNLEQPMDAANLPSEQTTTSFFPVSFPRRRMAKKGLRSSCPRSAFIMSFFEWLSHSCPADSLEA
jgi:hypothetical protein